MASKLEVEVEVKSSPEKIWESIRNFNTLFPKAFPDLYQSIEILEGDGKSVGSTRLIKYSPGLSLITTTTEKIESVDEEKKTLSHTVIDGDLLKFYNSFKSTVSLAPKGDGSVVKFVSEFTKVSEEVPAPDLFKDFIVKNFQDLDAYLLSASATPTAN